MSNYMDGIAVCPYYIKEEKGIVKCEAARINCKDKEMRRELIFGRCATEYKGCQFKLALDHYYDRAEKQENH
ncbi:MAG: hypothetical protein U0M06_15095 [Clostridia bacterium]|nr:hypothetical protein [Clostridia bacterium]